MRYRTMQSLQVARRLVARGLACVDPDGRYFISEPGKRAAAGLLAGLPHGGARLLHLHYAHVFTGRGLYSSHVFYADRPQLDDLVEQGLANWREEAIYEITATGEDEAHRLLADRMSVADAELLFLFFRDYFARGGHAYT